MKEYMCPECNQEMNPAKYDDTVYYCNNIKCDICFIEITRMAIK